MKTRVISVVDFSNFLNQNLETLLIASILEKKYLKLQVFDLNYLGHNKILPEKSQWQKNNNCYSIILFNNTTYSFFLPTSLTEQLKLIDNIKIKNNPIIINSSSHEHGLNSPFYDTSNEIAIFVDINDNPEEKIINFCMKQQTSGKTIYIFVYNYSNNVENNKILFHLRKIIPKNFSLIEFSNFPKFNSLKEISSIDPWNDVYKVFKSIF